MGDLWAGAEVQLASLVAELRERRDVSLSVVLFNEGRLAAEIRGMDVPLLVLPESQLTIVGLARGVIGWLRERRVDIVHTHKYKDNIIGALAAAFCGVPHIVRTIHGMPEPFKGVKAAKMRVYEAVDGVVIRSRVARLIGVSSEISRMMQDRYGVGKVVTINNGLRLQGVRVAESANGIHGSLGLRSRDRLLGIVGRLTTVKGHEYGLQALRLLLRHRDDIHLLIVGDGPLQASLQRRAYELGVEENTHFLGHRDDVHSIINSLDVFLLPSLHEGIPMVLLEAMVLMRPIVASAVGGIPEVLRSGEQGLLVRQGDPEALAEACRIFLDNVDLSRRCGRAARHEVEVNWSSRQMGERVWRLYRDVADTVS